MSTLSFMDADGEVVELSVEEAIPLLEGGHIEPQCRMRITIASPLCPEPIHLVPDNAFMDEIRADGVVGPVFTFSEVQSLKGMSGADVRVVCRTKAVFDLSTVEAVHRGVPVAGDVDDCRAAKQEISAAGPEDEVDSDAASEQNEASGAVMSLFEM